MITANTLARFGYLAITLTSAFSLSTTASAAAPPRIVGVPPADAGRGLIRLSEKEIRHYGGKNATHYLQSLDNGETWKPIKLPESYPNPTRIHKESPVIRQNPVTGEFIRLEPNFTFKEQYHDDGIYLSKGGIDGTWTVLRDEDGKGKKLRGILRSPLWVNNNKRIVIPGHGGGCYTYYSDDQGLTWKRSNVVNSPPHRPGGIHKGTRWNHGMVEGTIVELKNKKLWMIARTSQDQHYETFSSDYGETWSEAKPSRFWGTITMPTLHRLDDGRILFLWTNTNSLPEKETATGRGEDAFTNRDSHHAAISEDEGKTWIGFREIILDEHRNDADYGITPGSNDRGKHQSEVLQLDKDRVLLSCGQHPLHRKFIIMELDWLYQKERSSDLAKEGAQYWSTHQFIDKIVGHCGYNRTPGAQVENGALRVRRIVDPTLTNQNQGAVWNFPTGHTGKLTTKIRLEKGNQNGLQISLVDRYFNAPDPTVDLFANYVLKIDKNGKTPDGKQILTPGQTQDLTLIWQNDKKSASLQIDGKVTGITLPMLHDCPNGISYVHYYNPATETDAEGFSILHTHAIVK